LIIKLVGADLVSALLVISIQLL